MLNKQQIEFYNENGYVIPNFLLPEDIINEISGHCDRLLIKNPEFKDFCPNVLKYDVGFLNFARNPKILDMVEQLIGSNFALWNSSLFAKPAKNGLETPWHQDGEFWPIRPLATCTVWIAIDEANKQNGCLRIIRGSHKNRRLRKHNTVNDKKFTLHQVLDPREYDEVDAVDLELKRGQISLHDVYLLHGSKANESSKSRRGMTLRYMPTTSVFDRKVADELHENLGVVNHSERSLFLMRGVDESNLNDFRLRL